MALRDQIRILIVHDMSKSRGLITLALNSLNIRNVTTAENAKQASQVLAPKPALLVVSGNNMPEGDGLQLAHDLRASSKTKSVDLYSDHRSCRAADYYMVRN